jgi:hypothetical protein
MPQIDALIRAMQRQGPSPEGFSVKTLGKGKGGLWQVNLKVQKRQIRILFVPYASDIVWFRIHKKSSPQEQQRAYDLAVKRKREYEEARKQQEAHERRQRLNGRTSSRH